MPIRTVQSLPTDESVAVAVNASPTDPKRLTGTPGKVKVFYGSVAEAEKVDVLEHGKSFVIEEPVNLLGGPRVVVQDVPPGELEKERKAAKRRSAAAKKAAAAKKKPAAKKPAAKKAPKSKAKK